MGVICYKLAISLPLIRRIIMTICPVALTAGCKKCPIYAICPVKGIIGDYKPDDKKASGSKKTGGK